jgi:hypothetical protein
MERIAVQRRIEVPRMAARKRFGRYKRGEGKSNREAHIEKSPTLKKLEQIWISKRDGIKELQAKPHGGTVDPIMHWDELVTDAYYNELFEAIREAGLAISAADVYSFGIILKAFEREPGFADRCGLFLSAMGRCRK